MHKRASEAVQFRYGVSPTKLPQGAAFLQEICLNWPDKPLETITSYHKIAPFSPVIKG